MTAAVRVGWGALLILVPGQLVALIGARRSPGVIAAARALGLRHLVEGAALTGGNQRRAPAWIRAADLLHGASMLGLAAVRPTNRREALISAGGALSLLALSRPAD